MTDGLWLELISVYRSRACVRERETNFAAYLFPAGQLWRNKGRFSGSKRTVAGIWKKPVCLWTGPSMKMCNINKARAFEKKTLPSWSCHPKGKAHSKLLLNSQRPFCHQTPNCSLQTRDGQPPSRPTRPAAPTGLSSAEREPHPPQNTAHHLLE